jgi:hypothetical protein
MRSSRYQRLWNLYNPLQSGAAEFDCKLCRTTDLACPQKRFLVRAWSPSHWPALPELRKYADHDCLIVLSVSSAADLPFRIEALESV